MPHHSGFPRHPDEFYIEDDWCFDALPAILGAAEFAKGIYDPAVGVGTIPLAAIRSGFPAMGSDKIDRPKAGPFNSGVRDFLEPRTQPGWAANIVTNPRLRNSLSSLRSRSLRHGQAALSQCSRPSRSWRRKSATASFNGPKSSGSSSFPSAPQCPTAMRCSQAR